MSFSVGFVLCAAIAVWATRRWFMEREMDLIACPKGCGGTARRKDIRNYNECAKCFVGDMAPMNVYGQEPCPACMHALSTRTGPDGEGWMVCANDECDFGGVQIGEY